MRSRCETPSSTDFKYYGARGISVCEEWKQFELFQKWATENGYTDDLSIDRIDNEKGYSPDNCRWITQSEQSRNRRPYKHISRIIQRPEDKYKKQAKEIR